MKTQKLSLNINSIIRNFCRTVKTVSPRTAEKCEIFFKEENGPAALAAGPKAQSFKTNSITTASWSELVKSVSMTVSDSTVTLSDTRKPSIVSTSWPW